MALRARLFSRALHASRVTRAGGAPAEEVNEPGGRLFGEAIRKPGERRKLFDWEVPYVGSLIVASVMLAVGLNSRPETNSYVWAREEAIARQAAEIGSDPEE